MTKFYDTAPRPPSATRVLEGLASATEFYLSVRGRQQQLIAWRLLEVALRDAQDLLKAVI